MTLLRSSLLPLAGLAASLALADGRIPIAKPTMISVPGHYVVTRDIVGTGPLNLATLEIVTTDVLIDLDGHTITAGTDTAILIAPPVFTPGSIEVRNGQVRGLYRGIWHNGDAASRLRFEGLDISGSNLDPPLLIMGAPVVDVVGCTVHDSTAGIGIQITSGGLAQWTGSLTGNRVRRVPFDAIHLSKMVGGVVSDNVVTEYGSTSGSTARAIFLQQSDGVRIERNVLHGDQSSVYRYGISLDTSSHRSAILDNVISGDMFLGIYVDGDSSLLSGNTIGGTKGAGIAIHGSRNTLLRNTVESGTIHGVQVEGQFNLVEGNTLQGHGNYGLVFFGPTNNAYRGNLLHNNLSGTVSGTATNAGGNVP